MIQPNCKQCGRCCYFIIDGKPKRCKHLINITPNRRICRIFLNPHRVNSEIDMGIGGTYCIERVKSDYDYLGCPYNTGTKPLFETKFGMGYYEKKR